MHTQSDSFKPEVTLWIFLYCSKNTLITVWSHIVPINLPHLFLTSIDIYVNIYIYCPPKLLDQHHVQNLHYFICFS